ncbi:MAG: PAS domain S-box protein [Ginsengibacter sp.]
MTNPDYQQNSIKKIPPSFKEDEIAIFINKNKFNNKPGNFPKSLQSAISIILRSKGPMFLLWKPKFIFFFNDAFRSLIFEKSDASVLGEPIAECLPDLWKHIKPTVQNVLNGEGIAFDENVPVSLKSKPGESANCSFTYSPILGESSEICGVFGTCKKSNQFTTENSLKAINEIESESKYAMAEERLRLAVEASEMAVWEIELKTDDIKFSKKLPEIFGYDKSYQLSLDEIRQQLYPSDRAGVVKKAFDTSLQTGNFTFDTRIVKLDKSVSHIRVIGKLFFDKDNVPQRIYGTVRDITPEAENRQALEKSERRLRRLVMNAPVSIGILNGPEYIVEMMNDSALILMGKSKEEILNRPVLEVITELDTSTAKFLLDSVYKTGKPFSASEYPVKLKRNGVLQKVYINFDYHPLINSKREVYGIMVVGIDITEQVVARKKSAESEARFRLLADSLPLFVWSADKAGNMNYFNQAFYDYTGFSYEELNNEKWINIVHPDEKNENFKAWKKAINTGKDFNYEHRFKRFDGVYRWQLSRAIPLHDKSGKIQSWIGSSTDIQDIKNQEHQKDFFISMASHELKTPITSIKGYIQILQSMYAGSEDFSLTKSLDRIHLQIEKLTKLIGDMLDVSKIRSGNLSFQKTVFDMNPLIKEVIEEIEMTHPENKIIFKNGRQLPVFADRERISQVLTNLFTNAVKYSIKKGDIIVTSEKTQNNVMVSVKDEGIGIDRNYQQRIFERFYRVAGKSEKTFPGFGIGLFIASEIIKSHKGNIGVQSEPGKGSIFYFTLPFTKRELETL